MNEYFGTPVRRRYMLLGSSLVVAALVGFFAWFLHYVPFDLLSYLTWIGVFTVLAGVVSVAVPFRFLGQRMRLSGLIPSALGTVITVVGIVLPASVGRSSGPHQRLDDFLPEYQFTEYHEARARAPLHRVQEAARNVSLADMRAAVFLLRLRAIAGGDFAPPVVDTTPLLEFEPGSGFLPLDDSNPNELVYGMTGKPWTNETSPVLHTPEEFLSFDEPGQIRVAFNIRIVDQGERGILVSTETRTLGNDVDARRVFARYWRVIYPGSAIIRRVWLDAIISRAESPRPSR